MENASKALIIAGAILLAIVIISLGLIVVNNVRNVTDNTNLSEQEIQSFNAKFTSYEGDSVAGSRVNSLIQQVISTNQATTMDGKNNYVVIAFLPINYESTSWQNKYIGVKVDSTGDLVYSTRKNSANAVISIKDDDYSKPNNNTVHGVEVPQLAVKTGVNYKVKCIYNSGLVSEITVQKK